uniref:Vomeronasal type-1 receptor n=1 Tax=Peromyscus maniculatus bairdii TaxID=230844 RepID=A0A8C8TJM4_PERMB
MVLKFIKEIIFLFTTVLGTLGNISVSVNYMFSWWGGPEKKPIHLILIHLAFTNIIILLAKGLLNTIAAFGLRNFLDDIGCKILIYLERVARGLSICTSSLLTVVQAIIISPRASGWRRLRPNSWQVLPFLLLLWIFNVLISSNLLYYITAGSSLNRSRAGLYSEYCYMLPSGCTVKWLFLSLMALRDVIFQSLMGWSSGSMALHLYRHHKHVLYLHSSRLANRVSPEVRATWSVLVLMTCFLLYYLGDFISSFYIGSVFTLDSIILNAKVFLGVGYADLSPFILIIKDFHLASCCPSRLYFQGSLL